MSLLNSHTCEEKERLESFGMTSTKHSQMSDAFIIGFRCKSNLDKEITLMLTEMANDYLIKSQDCEMDENPHMADQYQEQHDDILTVINKIESKIDVIVKP